jgi:hypothetical protein
MHGTPGPIGLNDVFQVSRDDLVAESSKRNDVPGWKRGRWRIDFTIQDGKGESWRRRVWFRTIRKRRCR